METSTPTVQRTKPTRERPVAPDNPADKHAIVGAPAPEGSASPEYICPMHPEVHASKRGACPKCGMALEAAVTTALPAKVEYVCPMHAQIVRDAPGACPICGMALEPRTVTAEEMPNTELLDMRRHSS